MPQKFFTIFTIIYFIYHYFCYGDSVSFVQIGLILLWYLVFNLLYKEDKEYLNSMWSLINCCSIGFFTLFIAFPIEYGIAIDLWLFSLFAILLLFSGFKFSIFFR